MSFSDVKDILKENVATVTFEKKDGTVRVMKCTLMADKLPAVEVKEGAVAKAVNPDVVAVWDLESEGWRSFRIDSIKSVVI
jgi:hypothetical protein